MNQLDPGFVAESLPPPSSESGRTDDPFLGCLLLLSRIHDKPATPDTLLSGLPLENHRLTPALFPRAAQRAGLSAKIIKRSTLASVSPLLLPIVVLLKDGGACVLLSIAESGSARILLPESGVGEKTLALHALQEKYTGELIVAHPVHRFDSRTADSVMPEARHWFWGTVRRAWPLYAEVLIASLLINIFALAIPLYSMNVYDRVVPNNATETLWALSIGAGIVLLFDLVMKLLRGYFIDVAGKRLDVVLSTGIFERVLGIRMASRPQSVGAFASGLQEFESFREFITSATITTVIDLPFVVLFIAVMFWIGGPIAWIPIVGLPLVIGVSLLVQSPLARVVKETTRYGAQRQATLIESLVALETIKALGASGPIQRKWEQTINAISKSSLSSRFLSSCAVNFSGFIQQVVYIAVIVFGVYLIMNDRLTMGGLIACSILSGRALAPASQIAALLTRYDQSRNAIESMDRLMNLPTERPDDTVFVQRPPLQGGIEFRDVTFTYPEQSVHALKGISFRIAPGERVAFIGRIGSGKTTLEKLILGLYQPDSGSVLLDGADQRQIDPAALRRDIGYVPQDVVLFHGSVRDNIVLSAPFADDEAVLRAAAISGVAEFVNRSPQGFDLQVGERGERLSGGQRQAIAIARAELLSPPILLLDEPTSAMDTRSEEQFKAKLAANIGNRTLLLISHRGSLLSLVNRLIVIDGGRMVADGPKDAVLAALASGKIPVAG